MKKNKRNKLFTLLIAASFVGCSDVSDTIKSDDSDENDTIKLKSVATITANNNSTVKGTVIFTETDNLVSMTANISGLTPGNHAIHIHAVGDCSAADGSSAGGHWNPTNVEHGKWNTSSFHTGDIGNIIADSSGKGTISRVTDLWCLDCDNEAKNITGKSIIIHEGIDDFTSQPSGAAGARIGCGEIISN